MLTRKDFIADLDLPGIDNVAEQLVDVAAAQRASAIETSVLRCPLLVSPAQFVEPLDNFQHRRTFQIEAEHLPDAFGLIGIDHELPGARVQIVTQQDVPAGPFALLARSDLLVACAVGDDLALKLREGQQDVQSQAPEGRVGIELLSHGNEAHAVLLEEPHHPGEVDQ